MSDTPETDAAAFDAFDGQGGEVVFADLAKKLERERDEALKVIASLKKQLRRFASKREMPDPRPFYDRCEEAVK